MTDKKLVFLGTLYKMFSTKELNYKTISEKRIFLSSPRLFNDKFDGCVRVDYREFEKKYLTKMYKDNPKYLEIIKKAQYFESAIDCLYNQVDFEREAEFFLENKMHLFKPTIDKVQLKELVKNKYNQYVSQIKEIRNSYYVACFSKCEPKKNISMWNFYADSYKGFCVSYSFNRVEHNLFSTRIRSNDYDYCICKNLHKVIYTDSPVEMDIDHLLTLKPKDVYFDKRINALVKKALCRKNSSWKNEKEIRLILKKEDAFMTVFKERITIIGNKGIKIDFPFISNISICNLKTNKKNILKTIDMAYKLKAILYLYCVDTAQNMMINEGDELETNKEIWLERIMSSFN